MELLNRQIYERFVQACPQVRCGLYGPGQRLLTGTEDCPKKAPENTERTMTVPLSAGWFIYMPDIRPGDPEAGRIRRFIAAIERLSHRKQDLITGIAARQDKMSLLLNRLFTLSTADDVAYTAMSAVNMGYDMTLPRAICLFELEESPRGGGLREGLLQQALDTIRNQTEISEQDLVGAINSHQLVLCKTVRNGEIQRCRQLANRICRTLSGLFHSFIRAGIGEICDSVSEYSGSFLEISQILRAQQLLNGTEACYWTAEHRNILDILNIPPEQLNHFFSGKAKLLEESPQLLETIEALLRCDANVRKTADMLYVHHNTVLFRIKHIRKLLALDPLHKDSGLATLFLLYYYCRLKPMIQPGYPQVKAAEAE